MVPTGHAQWIDPAGQLWEITIDHVDMNSLREQLLNVTGAALWQKASCFQLGGGYAAGFPHRLGQEAHQAPQQEQRPEEGIFPINSNEGRHVDQTEVTGQHLQCQ